MRENRRLRKAPLADGGGQTVVGGTRVRVAIISFGCHRQGMSVDEIVQQYPSLKPAGRLHDAFWLPSPTITLWLMLGLVTSRCPGQFQGLLQ